VPAAGRGILRAVMRTNRKPPRSQTSARAVLASAALACTPSRPDAEAQPTTPPADPHAHAGHGAMHHQHGEMPHRFEDAEAWAKEFDSPERLRWQKPDEVVAHLALPRDARIADVGAGTGYFAVRFARAVPEGRVFASDIEPDMVRYLRERAEREGLDNLVAVEGTADDPKIPEPVDVVFFCNVVHHIANRRAFFERLDRALAPGGRIVIVDFQKDAPPDSPGPPPAHRIALPQMVEELASAGWALTTANTELLPFQYVAIFEPQRE
jgi:ubiquinone/menaquinone biosynthesis C-methylase UbiE